MLEKNVYEYALEAIFNQGADKVTERWKCPDCGRSFLKISCAKPHCRQDLLLTKKDDSDGWKVFALVYPESAIENSCYCTWTGSGSD